MPEQALYLKWRPLTFSDVVGQEHVTRTLRNSLKTGRIRHAYLFSGPRGTGKTTSARLLAKAVNCTHEDPDQRPCNACDHCRAMNEGRFLDLIEIDAASHTGVDDVRDLRDKIAFAPSSGGYKVYIIDEVHRFSGNAFDALLKTLEEPPQHALFVLATTEIDKVPATIKSRCLPFEFRRVSLPEVADRLAMIAETEGLVIDRDALELIAREGTGSVRDSISLLDQIVADPQERITLSIAQRVLGTANVRAVRDLGEALVNGDVPQGLQIIKEAIDGGSDPRQFAQQIVDMLRAILLTQTAGLGLVEASQEERELYARLSQNAPRRQLLSAIRAFNEAANASAGSWQPQLALELALIESLQVEAASLQAASLQVEAPAPQMAQPMPSTAPAAKPTHAPPSDKTSAPASAALTTIRERWEAVKQLISNNARDHGHSKLLPGLLKDTMPLHLEGHQLTVGGMAFNIAKLNMPERLAWVERAIEVTVGYTLKVQFVELQQGQGGGVIASPSAELYHADQIIEEEAHELAQRYHGYIEDAPQPPPDEAQDPGQDEV